LILRPPQTSPFIGWSQKHLFDRQAQDTEFIEVQYEPLPTGRQAGPSAQALAEAQTPGCWPGKVEGVI
jgi:hypothetical protein